MYRDENGDSARLFTMLGVELREMISAKIEAQAASIAAIEESPHSRGDSPLATRLREMSTVLRTQMRGFAFAREHVDKADIFKLSGLQLAAIHTDLEPIATDVEQIARLHAEEQHYSERAAKQFDGLSLAGTQENQAQRWRRW